MPRQAHRIGECAATGADHEPLGVDAGFERRFQERHAFLDGEGVRLTGGAEQREAVAAPVEQPACVVEKSLAVDAEILAHRNQHRRPNAVDGAGDSAQIGGRVSRGFCLGHAADTNGSARSRASAPLEGNCIAWGGGPGQAVSLSGSRADWRK